MRQRQFRVTDRSGLTTLVNLSMPGAIRHWAYQRAAHEAGYPYETVRVTAVPWVYECALPWDCVPLVVPAYPLPNETQQCCEACQWVFLSAIETRYCTRRCAERALVRRHRPVDPDLPVGDAWMS